MGGANITFSPRVRSPRAALNIAIAKKKCITNVSPKKHVATSMLPRQESGGNRFPAPVRVKDRIEISCECAVRYSVCA
jgi:hypothetical protein